MKNMIYTLSLFSRGQITIPKKLRDGRFRGAKKFIAKETEEGLLIKPIEEDFDIDFRQLSDAEVDEIPGLRAAVEEARKIPTDQLINL